MISFSPITESFLHTLPDEAQDRAAEFSDAEEVLGCFSHGCLLLRAEPYPGLYSFFMPEPYGEDADPDGALADVERYAVWQEVPLHYICVPAEALPLLTSRYRHTDIKAVLPDNSFFAVTAHSETEDIDEIPTLRGALVTLTRPTKKDAVAYETLCRDRETTENYGYDVLADHPEAGGKELIALALEDFDAGVSVPFAVRDEGGRFIGELVFDSFDCRGGANLAVRILPYFRRHGYALDAVRTALTYAKETLALFRVHAVCKKTNTGARVLLHAAFAEEHETNDDCVRYLARFDEAL